MSRPSTSLPAKSPWVPGAKSGMPTMLNGPWTKSSGAASAITTMATNTAKPKIAVGRAKKRRTKFIGPTPRSFAQLDSGIGDGIGDVGGKIEQADQHGRDDEDAQQQRIVARRHRFISQRADAGPAEELFHQPAAAHQDGSLQARIGHQRNQ